VQVVFVLAEERPDEALECLRQRRVPTQDRVRCHDAHDSREVATAEGVAFHRQTASLVVGQAQSSGTGHGAEHAIFLEQVVNDRLLVSIDPAREQQDEEGERRRQQVHGGSLPQCRAPFNRCQIGEDSRGRLPPTARPSIASDPAFGRVFAQDGSACRAAGIPDRIERRESPDGRVVEKRHPGRLFHDFRRTAVRNLERGGVPRSVAMKMTGHKTESIYRRYAIVSESDLREGSRKLAAVLDGN
jgi:hypothetical protein